MERGLTGKVVGLSLLVRDDVSDLATRSLLNIVGDSPLSATTVGKHQRLGSQRAVAVGELLG